MIWWPTQVPTLRHGLITLRSSCEKDIQDIYEAAQDPLISRFTTVPSFYTLAHAESFVHEKDPNNFAQKSELRFVITKNHGEDEVFCGVISLHTISLSNHRAELGYWTAASVRGQGIGTTAARLITDYALTSMGFRRIEAAVDIANQASKALLISAGYTFEGVMRQKITSLDGTQKDMALFSIVNV